MRMCQHVPSNIYPIPVLSFKESRVPHWALYNSICHFTSNSTYYVVPMWQPVHLKWISLQQTQCAKIYLERYSQGIVYAIVRLPKQQLLSHDPCYNYSVLLLSRYHKYLDMYKAQTHTDQCSASDLVKALLFNCTPTQTPHHHL